MLHARGQRAVPVVPVPRNTVEAQTAAMAEARPGSALHGERAALRLALRVAVRALRGHLRTPRPSALTRDSTEQCCRIMTKQPKSMEKRLDLRRFSIAEYLENDSRQPGVSRCQSDSPLDKEPPTLASAETLRAAPTPRTRTCPPFFWQAVSRNTDTAARRTTGYLL